MNRANREQWLRWLCKVRLIGITIALAVQLTARAYPAAAIRSYPLQLFLLLTGIWYAVGIGYWVLLRYWADVRKQAYLQTFLDALIITGLVYATGTTEGWLVELYALLVIVSAVVLDRSAVFALAAFCTLAYSLATVAAVRGWLPPTWTTTPDPRALEASIGLTALALLVAGYVSGLLAAKLREAGQELEEQGEILESLRALNDNIVRSMSGGLVTTDLNGRIYFVNNAGERILERSAEQLVKHDIAEVLGQRGPQLLNPASAGGLPPRSELTVEVNGRPKVVGLTVTALQAVGRGEVGRVFHFQDLTELRRLEGEIKIRDRMAALGRLAAGIAHEIRNPLASMAGSVKLLTSFGPLDEDQRKIADIVIKESERLNRIISDFLNYAREGKYKFEDVDLRALLEDVLALVRNSPRCGPGIAVLADLGGSPLRLRADADRLRQVAWNLCDNALKAMNGKGSLSVTARQTHGRVRVEFKDTGCGLKAGSEEHIFEPFHSGFRDGTGLGLATVYTIVEAHQGKIWAESPPDGGARFVVQLPLEGKAAASV